MLQYSQIPEFLKTAARSTFGRNIPCFRKCILSQIELIRQWKKNTNFITTCLNFKLELTEHIRNRNSISVDLAYTSAYWLRLCIRVYDSGKEKQKNKNAILFNDIKYIESLSGYLFQTLFFMDFKIWLYRVESCKYLYPPVNLYWLFWLHWNEMFIPQMLSSVAINYSYSHLFTYR